MRTERKLFSGIMNLDDPNEVIASTHHREAKNILFKGNPGEMRAESIPGNTSVSAELPTGYNICIGSYYDELKQNLYYFIYNSLGYDTLYRYNTLTKTVTNLLQSKSDSQESLFDFDPDYPIASVNILYRTEEDGDILLWTDRKNRPMRLNLRDVDTTVNATKIYNGQWKKKYLTVARPMPLLSPVCQYKDDATIAVNNLRSKAYQFRYRWVYRDFTKSTWSPYSRLFAPDLVDDLANDKNQLKNNRIDVKYQTGAADVVKIEIAARHTVGTTFTDPFLIDTLDKAKLSLANDVEVTYNFYNNSSYPYLDLAEANQLFDYVPLKANAQELLNGNIITYGGITEGITSNVTMNVTKSITSITNTNTSALFTATLDNKYTINQLVNPPYIGGYYDIIMAETPQVGDVYAFTFTIRKKVQSTGNEDRTFTITITVNGSNNTTSGIETALYNALIANSDMVDFNLNSSVFKLSVLASPLKGIRLTFYNDDLDPSNPLDYSTWVYTITKDFTYVGGQAPDPTGVNSSCYKHKSRYTFGMCYFDEFGVTDGVLTTTNMDVITPEATTTNLANTQMSIPKITFSVNHRPPSWAKYFSFVRTTNLTVSKFKTIVAANTYQDGTYGYIGIAAYQTNTQNIEAYSFSQGDRIRLFGNKNSSAIVSDYAVVDLVTTAQVSGSPANEIWIKVKYDASTMGAFASGITQYVEVYSPAFNTPSGTQLYYEFGETYEVGTDAGGLPYHKGMTDDQVYGVKPAVFEFIRGDIYSRQRNNEWILDMSMSDRFDSQVNGNGRALVEDEYAKQRYYPTLLRYSLEYQAGTSINQTNRFYAANFDEYDRERGDIQRLKTRGRQLRVFQSRACGVVPILQSVLQTADGSNILSQSTEVINKIQYYLGDYGIGNQYCSLASSAQADYFSDPVRGCQVRLSNDGITPISELYKAHFFLNPLISKYNKVRTHISTRGKAKIIAMYDQFNEEFITCMQESTGTSPDKTDPYTFGFNEFRNSYTSFYDYVPEWMCTAENLIISWKNGVLYTHDNTTNYCRFYGVQYYPSLTLLFNEFQQLKKHYNTITMLANKVWAPYNNGDITTNLGQYSKLLSTDFILKDDKLHAAFKRNETNAYDVTKLYNGDVLKGNWAKLKIQPVNGNEFVNLYYIELSILEPFYNR